MPPARLRHLIRSLLVFPATLSAQQPRPQTPALPTIAAKTAGLERRDGFVPIVLDRRTGSVWLELPAEGTRLLLCTSLATGLGSNPVGLDRGRAGRCDVAHLQPAGPVQVVVLENWSYRSTFPDNPAHSRSVEEAFAPSTVASLPLVAQEGDRVLVDAAELLRRDWNDVTGALAAADQGSYGLVRERSYVYAPSTRAYPRNTELETALTFEASDRPGRIVAAIAPDGRAFTVRQHSPSRPCPMTVPAPGVRPPHELLCHPFKDYAQPVQQPLARRWIDALPARARESGRSQEPHQESDHLLRRPRHPEPIRSATLEGARFWTQAFDQAGLVGGFRVELLPEGADPMDLRYNVIQWENRNELGWSIGGGLFDPAPARC